MKRRLLAATGLALLAVCSALAWQRFGIRDIFPEREDDLIPPGADAKSEFYFARLRYQNFRASGMWAMRGSWSVDWPKADRQFLQGIRRLTRIDARPVEAIVDLRGDDIFDYPFLYAVEAGHWALSDAEARKLREFVDRGGFLMTDDFHGTFEWSVFTESLNKGFGDRAITEIESSDPIFHVLYDLDQRVQVPGIVNFPFTKTYEYDGYEARWRAVRDDKGRVVIAMCLNQDNGDAWEWADNPNYPEKFTSQAYRMGINYIIYAMTH